MAKQGKKVFVGMSGGVDSSVCAYLLKDQGYDVVGVHLRCWNKDGCDEQEARDARLVADKLDIPFYVLDMEKEYKKQVVDYMIESYQSGLTPNPDVMCNQKIKFGTFLKKALEMGADYVATGHYAKVKEENGRFSIYAGEDKNKDQSYFLWTLTQDQLKHALFPLGDMKKDEVREVAKNNDLHVADKKDSQGICFIGKVTLQEFLSQYLKEQKGKVLNNKGEVVGEHDGAHFYTIGQRHGLGVALGEPHYVAEKDIKSNTIVLAPEKDKKLEGGEIRLAKVKAEGDLPQEVLVRIRYRQGLQKATLRKDHTLELDKPVKFIAPGQSAVFYNKEGKLIGGGIIK